MISGPRATCDDCMFGFSVAQHIEAGESWLLIGAPEADTGQPGVTRGGAVYKCPVQGGGDCQIIPFDKNGILVVMFTAFHSYCPVI